jgi:hypothetical protein
MTSNDDNADTVEPCPECGRTTPVISCATCREVIKGKARKDGKAFTMIILGTRRSRKRRK